MPDLDYIDPGVSYLLGMLVTRGRMMTASAECRVVIHFPKALLGGARANACATDGRETRLHFVECKLSPLSLAHLSQLLGYCRVALPTEAWLLSPDGVGSALSSLVTAYARRDALEYEWPERRKPRHIAVARWNADSRSPDPAGALPTGAW